MIENHKNLNISDHQVLCELQMAMLERGLEVGEDVDRSIMSKEVSDLFFISWSISVLQDSMYNFEFCLFSGA